MEYNVSPLGDRAIVLEFSDKIDLESMKSVQNFAALLDKVQPSWMIEYIPAYTTITIFYKIQPVFSNKQSPYETISKEIDALFLNAINIPDEQSRVVRIPVLYGDEYGPDLNYVAKYNHLTEEDVINIHTTGDYTVHMIGFSPGFPFIGGMSTKIAVPRRNTPRLSIPARSVGIAGSQTGVYPIETPGGWQLIGRTPLELFLPDQEIPSLLKAGDKIEFYQITKNEYDEMVGDRL